MSKAFRNIEVHEIPGDILFEGYYWYSNAKIPEVIPQEPIKKGWFKEMPFIIEANFYSREKKLSIQVRHVDGKYHVARIDLDHADASLLDGPVTYLGHDLKGLDYQVVEAWEPKPDPLCDGMEVLQPSWTAFVGFVNR